IPASSAEHVSIPRGKEKPPSTKKERCPWPPNLVPLCAARTARAGSGQELCPPPGVSPPASPALVGFPPPRASLAARWRSTGRCHGLRSPLRISPGPFLGLTLDINTLRPVQVTPNYARAMSTILAKTRQGQPRFLDVLGQPK